MTCLQPISGLLCAGLALAGFAATACAADDSPAPIVLFDGKTLDGWKKTDFYGAGEVTVEDGQVRLKAGKSMTGITTTRTDLPTVDYELSYEAMRLDGNDFFAAATFPVQKAHITLVNGGWGSSITGLSSVNGADASENSTSTYFKYQDRTWYRFRIRVTASVIRCWIGDEEVVTLDHQESTLGTRLETHANRPLGFATWETTGALRDIKLRKLTPKEVEEANRIDDK